MKKIVLVLATLLALALLGIRGCGSCTIETHPSVPHATVELMPCSTCQIVTHPSAPLALRPCQGACPKRV